ncbi:MULTISPECIES: putative bifunctional diguanylate cyclase/phosphodiesterase [unclassified Coleofasciculus]|uniref:putative bifunctional diguanylate cyclase/phosphodiesterase n=1 Tax=unclassified Coleofasciculus TaxID=2692782 RepID=UPI0018803B94|nr:MULTISPECIES: EAL domain-containing response regulator [unclassified Coleofasciculus]MBE9129048.1 EAL domain-containing protein [Coleofasciculus sp. LEGE 07081]MBE9151629.1 EAL domain-containing protein [Coleofasciculus sp. LEGE 07092]
MAKILVIEDERSIRINLLKLMVAEGFEAIDADNGNSGVQLAFQEQPDLIICDILMPGLDGYQVLKTLQQNPVTATVPFIFLTAKADRAEVRQAMNLGADDYLTKPFTRAEVLEAIATRLQKRVLLTRRHTLELKQTEALMSYLLRYDQLTNLPNRFLLQERFNHLVAETEAESKPIPILSLGLDQLNQLNHTLGPASGDLLLQAVAERLLSCLNQHDTVAQVGAEQFVILLAMSDRTQDVTAITEALLDIFSSPFRLGVYEIQLTAQIGIALFGRDGGDLNTLIKHASAAREDAKQSGKQPYQFYIAAIGAKSQEALLLEQQLRQALEREEFQVYYQPKVNLLTGQIEGAEALVRWHHSERGSVSPTEFIPVAEKTGLIVPLGEWVLRTACAQARIWQIAGYYPLRVAVNLSGHQFNQPHLDRLVVEILRDSELDPSYLELELTESTLMQDPETAIATLQALKTLGIRISIDDFGTGYSSLSYLRQFPFDVLKIDRSFVCQVTEDSKNAAITSAILQMARSLNLKVVAEGVETSSQLAFLQGHQCDEIQGYWFSPPLSAQTFGELLSSGKCLPLLGSRE